MAIAKVGRRGQLTIPKQVREDLGLKEGDKVGFVERDGSYALVPLTKTILDYKGSIPVDGPQDIRAIRAQVRAERAKRYLSSSEEPAREVGNG